MKKYLKLFDLDTRKNLVRFLGVKGFDEIIPFLENEFLENRDKEYRVSIINSLRLIENDEIAKDYLKKIDKEKNFKNKEIPLTYIPDY